MGKLFKTCLALVFWMVVLGLALAIIVVGLVVF